MRKPKPAVVKALAAALVFISESARGDCPLRSQACATIELALKLATGAGYNVQRLRDVLEDADATTDAKLAACERLIVAVGEAPIILALGIAARSLGEPS